MLDPYQLQQVFWDSGQDGHGQCPDGRFEQKRDNAKVRERIESVLLGVIWVADEFDLIDFAAWVSVITSVG